MTSQRPVRFGTLGAAQITPNALIKPAQEVPGVEVVAIAARDWKRAEEFATEHRIARVYDTYQEVINDPDIDVIYNPLPNSYHCEWTIYALRAGKNVLCEKPLAANAAEAERMAAVARETGLFLGEAFHYRYHPLAARVREIVRGGALGRLHHLEANFSVPLPPDNIRYDWNLAGGATMDLGCYPLHMLREFSGRTPRVVKASAKTGPPNIDIAMEVQLDIDGAMGRMTCAMAQDAQLGATFTARGDSGELFVVNPVGPQWGNQLTLKTGDGEKQESISGDTTYTYQLRAFIARLRGDEAAFPTDGAEGVLNMRVIDEVYRAAGLPLRAT